MKQCIICNKTSGIIHCSKKLGMTLCIRHYKQLYRTGKLTIRNQNDKNKVVEYSKYAKMFLYNRYDIIKAETLIDLEDVEKVRNYKWRLQSSGYSMGRINSKTILLHRYIMNPKKNMQIDHINHNKLDNRKQNLRIVTPQQNNFNRKFKTNSLSGIKGIMWDKEKFRWVAQIKINKQNIVLGYFIDVKEAIKTRITKEIELFGRYANIQEAQKILMEDNIPVGKALRLDKK